MCLYRHKSWLTCNKWKQTKRRTVIELSKRYVVLGVSRLALAIETAALISVNLQIYRFWNWVLLLLLLLFLVMNLKYIRFSFAHFLQVSQWLLYINAQASVYVLLHIQWYLAMPQQQQPPDLAKIIHFAAEVKPIISFASGSLGQHIYFLDFKECTSFSSPFNQ